ncbi:MAG: hypothetical protein QMB65_02575, partial [Vicingaceae bacterium]
YWIDKSLILLADNYTAQEDLFQAKITLKNVIDKSKFPKIVSTASEKLNKIEAQEAAMIVTEEEIEIDVELFDDAVFQKLFSEDEEIIEEELPQLEDPKTKEEETAPSITPIEEPKNDPIIETEDELEETPEDE